MEEEKVNHDEILDKIKKLLALANSSNEHEARLAAERANELLVKYNLTMQQVGAKSDITERDTQKRGRFGRAELYITDILRTHFQVKTIKWTDPGVRYFKLVGSKTNVQVAAYVYDFLYRKFNELWVDYYKEHGIPANKITRDSYFYGLWKGLNEQLSAARNRVQNSMGLVLVKDPAVEEYANKKWKLQQAKERVLNINAAIAGVGYEHGKNIHISRGIEGQREHSQKFLGGGE